MFDIKPGYKTSEFWTTLIGIAANMVGVLVVLGYVNPDDATGLSDAIKAVGASIQLLVVNVALIWRYVGQRQELKHEELKTARLQMRYQMRLSAAPVCAANDCPNK